MYLSLALCGHPTGEADILRARSAGFLCNYRGGLFVEIRENRSTLR